MKLLLRSDVNGVGKKGDVVEVADEDMVAERELLRRVDAGVRADAAVRSQRAAAAALAVDHARRHQALPGAEQGLCDRLHAVGDCRAAVPGAVPQSALQGRPVSRRKQRSATVMATV